MSKLNDAEAEAAEVEVWIEFSVRCKYLKQEEASELEIQYERILGKLVTMLSLPEQWTIHSIHEEGSEYA